MPDLIGPPPPLLCLRYRCCCSWHWWESETESVVECEIVELMLAIERAINHNRIIRVSDYLQIRAHYQYGFVQSKLKSALIMPLLRTLEFDQTCSTNTYAHTSFQCTYTHRINVDFVCCSVFFLLSCVKNICIGSGDILCLSMHTFWWWWRCIFCGSHELARSNLNTMNNFQWFYCNLHIIYFYCYKWLPSFFFLQKPDGIRGWTSFLSSSLSNERYVYYYDYFFYLFNFYYCSAHILTIMRPALQCILTYIRW